MTGTAVGLAHSLRGGRRLRYLCSSLCADSELQLSSLQGAAGKTEQSWLQRLTPDPEAESFAPNKEARQVRSGHYVPVAPSALSNVRLVIYSPPVASMLGISVEEAESEAFTAFFSGEQGVVPALESWCTPYALSIMGQRQVSNCPFRTGNGYGDGRAISVGEVEVNGQRWEMQLKGAGRTPFCRGGDGRSVLRSSIREFLASEAMHNLGIGTTRGLCLIVSDSEMAARPWYSDGASAAVGIKRDPDRMIMEPCAIATRVAPSFLRVGHIDLFARRAASPEASATAQAEYRQIIEHALFREYPDVAPGKPLEQRALAMLDVVAERIAAMVAGWLRVGFCQGNFNADNCLISGNTMDYGPFGFMDSYDPLFAKWTGSGDHYAFLNQPGAACMNFYILLTSVGVLLDKAAEPKLKEVMQGAQQKIKAAADDTFRLKLGFVQPGSEVAAKLWQDLEPLMRKSDIDYTIFWRQLAVVVTEPRDSDESTLVAPLMDAFYSSPSPELLAEWASWLQQWLTEVDVDEQASGDGGGPMAISTRLRATNPKYVPREWMLAAAYEEAERGNFSLVHELYALFSRPYDEQPELEAKYFRRAPNEALTKGGLAYFS
eukprot:CAMPEP_0172764210 /NCGR_PEP_ID=MMETSP1074-20121228/176811_1 /TAXON_ID=2916 /ORGANISM="Ceratium fusus, Strain PA161109" /LENGTH=603 /DNA_ID=CAMNT_0013598935 /DNA_START=223 /DNA_END=2034 /DNA_ORIENTATION=-